MERRYAVKKKPTDAIDPVSVLYEVEESDSDGLSGRFFVKITPTQAARENLEQDIARWCELYNEKLPPSGGTTPADLDYVVRPADRGNS